MMRTVFIIPTLGRPTLQRAMDSASNAGGGVIVCHDSDHKGAGYCRNLLVKQVKTEWVCMLDDDDTVTEDYVQRLEQEIESHPEADLIHFREYFVETGELLPYWPNIAWGNVGISFAVKTELARRIPFRTEPFEDYEFIKRVDEAGYNVFFSKFVTYRVRH